MRFRNLWLGVLASLFTATIAFAQPVQQPDWKQSLPGAVGTALAVSAAGDSVTVGIESPSAYDANYGATLVIQRRGSDGAAQWTSPVRWTSPAAGVRPSAVLTDAVGNVYVLGTVGDFNFPLCVPEVSPCTGPITIFNAWWLVQKYSAAGALLWERRQLQVGFVPVRGAVDAAGDLYFALDPNSTGRTTLVTKLSGATGASLWSAGTIDAAKPGALALTPAGTVVVAGASVVGLSLNEFSATDGARLVRTVYPAAAGAYAPGFAIGPQGELAVTGKSAAGLFVALESAARQTRFSTSFGAGTEGRRVAVDPLGNVVVAGLAAGSTGTNWVLMRVDAVGTPLHAPVTFDRHATALEAPLALAVAPDGAAYVAGAAGPAPSTDLAATQAVTLRLAPTGAIDWVATESAGTRVLDAGADGSASVTALVPQAMTLLHYPAAVPVPTPTSLVLSSTSVRGGTRVTGRVTLSSNAGAAVVVSSSHPAIVSVPSAVTVPVGQTSASFTVTTGKVRTATTVTITVRANGVTRSAVLTVLR